MSPIVAAIIAVSVGYFAGSVPFGYLAGRFKGIDLRTVGSKNIGATNAGRQLGLQWFFIVFVCDMLKGYLPATALHVANHQLLDAPIDADLALFCGMGALLGHSFPVWLGFRGGKAVATGLGVLLALHPAAAGIALGVFIVVVASTRYVSVGSVVASLSAPIVFWIFEGSRVFELGMFGRWLLFGAAAVLITWRHRGNLARVAKGTEPKVGPKPTSPGALPS